MSWRELAAESPYQAAMAIRRSLQAGQTGEAMTGIEELIEALSRSERRALKSHLVRLMAHIIKWRTQTAGRSRGWLGSIQNARDEIREIQEETPSLTDDVIRGLWDKAFEQAKRQAEGEMDQESAVSSLAWEEVFSQEYHV
jgi:hypothetical protein